MDHRNINYMIIINYQYLFFFFAKQNNFMKIYRQTFSHSASYTSLTYSISVSSLETMIKTLEKIIYLGLHPLTTRCGGY